MAAREEVLAYILHTLSSTIISPLRLSNDGSVIVASFEHEDNEMSGCDWLKTASHFRLATASDSDVDKVMKSMVDESDITLHDKKIIWMAGLKLVHLIVNNIMVENMSDDALEPHILLSTLMDSYYHCDDDGDLENVDSSESDPSNASSSLAMFQLRSILATIAIEKSIKVTQYAIETSATTRWRRLRSMVDDVTSLFKKMLINQLDSALDCESTHALQHIIVIATNLFVKKTFPACRDLIEILLNHGTDAAFTTRVLQTSYCCYGVLTSLAVLLFVFGEVNSDALHMIIRCLSDPKTDFIFKLMLKQQAVRSSDIMRNETRFCLWDSIATHKCKRGSDLLEDILLYPCVRVTRNFYACMVDNSEKDDDDSDESSEDEQQDEYDSLGIAVIAFTLHQNAPIASAYNKEQSWTLMFPHVHIFLSGMHRMSSTMNDLSRDDLNETKVINAGLAMLDELMPNAAENVEQYSDSSSSTCDESSVACCTMILVATVESLLSTVIRLSMVEASIHNNPNTMPLKYSSRKVVAMAERLLDLYNPITRVRALASLAEKMRRAEQSKVLLPRVLDWIRPVIMSLMSVDDRIAGSKAHSISYNDTAIVIVAITDVISPLMRELEFAFDTSKPPLPTHLSDFMSMTESYTSLLSVFRSIRMWVKRVESGATNSINNNDNAFHQIVVWTSQNEAMLKGFEVLLSDLLEFWSRACSPTDAKVYVGENTEPPIGWHRLFLLLHSLREMN
ncbi:hypothetical protein ACHAXN_006198 [Cyclotella atomus]|jgi:hypothetical protein